MRRQRWIAPMLIAGAIFTVVSAAEDGARSDKVLRVDQTTIDVGEVFAGRQAIATFVIHNDGDRDIRILRAKPS
jgi:hypothetical protein